MSDSKTNRILLWTIPRSVSGAFLFSIATLPNVQCFYEPYSAPYYRSNPLEAMKMSDSQLNNRTYKQTDAVIQAEYKNKDAVFAKNFPYSIRGRYEVFLDESFKDFTHTFLIRNPQRAVLSYYKGYNYNLDEFLEAYLRGEIGFESLYEFYSFLKSRLGINPLSIDADDLLANPERMMKAYCNNVGLTYREGMTKWEPWPQPGSPWHELKDQDFFYRADKKWIYNAITSTGFGELKPLPPIPDDLPFEVKKCIEESFVVYDKLRRFRLVL